MELFRIGFLSFTIIDVFDIAIVSLVFYWIYKALKNTIAVQILFGMIILIGLSFFAEAVKLSSISWIIRMISDIWLIAFIILFQPELRRMLLMLTQGKIFNLFFSKSNISQTIDGIVQATIEMSEKHIGALIVFTRTQKVEMSSSRDSIQLNATVSKELILSIFNTKSPLHDGAVIIDNQMIKSARNVLPVSQVAKYEGRNLGTRHRAALGLSEQIDAVILVVSEETGSISIAHRTKFHLNIKKEELLKVLNQHLYPKKQQQ